MASTDALPTARKGVAYRVTFPIFDADGDLVTGAAGLDSEVSKDAGTFADCTNEATEIATSSGIYYLDLTATEMNADTVAVVVKTSTTGAKTTPLFIYPEEDGDIRVNVTAVGGAAQTPGDIIGTIGGIGTAGGAAVNVDPATDNYGGGISGATSATTKVGTQTGTFANTSNVNGVYHVMTGTATALDIVYQFLTSGGTTPVSVTWTGYVNSANDTVTVAAWNHVAGAWETLTTIVGQAGTVNVVRSIVLYQRHSGTSAGELGKIYIRLYCTGMTNPVLNTDQIYVSYAITSRTVGYSNGAVWVDTTSSNTGTLSFVDGTADNPVSTLAAARTICTAVGLKRIHFAAGSSVTLASDSSSLELFGNDWLLALGGQTITNTHIQGATVTGTGAGTSPSFVDCAFGTVTLPACEARGCFLTSNTSGGFTCAGAGDYFLLACASGIAGNNRPTITFYAGDCNVNLRNYSGGITLAGMTNAGCDCSVEGSGNCVIDATCTAGSVVIRGMFTLTNSQTGTLTVTDTARMAEDQSLASVTGAVGSVTGAVGSVTGAVGSVTGAVGSVTAQVTANVTAIDGNPTNDNSATLKLKQLDIHNTGSGAAINAVADAGAGILGRGNGASGYGIHGYGPSATGILGQGSGSSGKGIWGVGQTGIYAQGQTTGPGLQATGAGTGNDFVGNIVGDLSGTVTTTTGVTNAVTVGTMNSGTITSATFAAGALGAVWDETVPGAHASGTSGHILGTALPDIAPDATGGLPIIGGTQAVPATLAAGAITTGTMDASALAEIAEQSLLINDVLVSPTTTTASVTLSAGSASRLADEDALIGCKLFHFNDRGGLIEVRTVVGFDLATLRVDVDAAWTATPVNNDVVKIWGGSADSDKTMKIGDSSGRVTLAPVAANAMGFAKNTAVPNFGFKMVLLTDHVTPATGKAITAERSIDGGAFASCANSAVEISDGWYKINLAASDLNGDVVLLKFTGTGCDQADIEIITEPNAL